MYNQSQIFHPEPLRQPERLPILEYRAKILELVKNNPIVIIVGETGFGKTTQLPLILQELLEENEKILITQPRRIAAISVAKYVAERIGCEIGEEVGYQIRFEDRTTEGTKINFVTDGILLRKIQVDPLLSEYSIIMIDEAHERSINIDLCLGLLKQIQKLRKEQGLPELKIIISSATLEKEKFQIFFESAPVLEVEGRMYEVKEHYLESPTYYIYEEAAKLVKKIIEETNEGDILIFMPGREEIEATAREIQKLSLPIEVLQLYGDMPVEEQEKIFYPGIQRRVIIATNIAETSVTVPRIRYVIDSGLIKVLRYYPEKRYAALVTEKHSKAGCIQRKGRAGRLAPGEYYALFTREDFESRKEFSEPEIKRSNLAHVVLYMKNLGIDNIEEFDFIDKPEKRQIDEAIRDLKILGALDENGQITDIGKEMVEYPLDPRLARMIVEAIRNNYDCLYEICVITSFFGQRSVFLRPQNKEEIADKAHSRFKHPTSDFITFLKIWVEWKKNNMSQDWARENFLNFNVLIEANKIVNDLLKILGRNGAKAFTNGYEEIERKLGIEGEIEKIEKCILAGLIGNVSRRFYRFQYERILDGRIIYIFPGSSLMNSVGLSLFTFLELRESPKSGKKFATFCQKIRPAWLIEVAPHLYKVGYSQYDIDKEGRVIEKVEIYFGSTKIGEDIISPRNIEEASRFLAEFLTSEERAEIIKKDLGIDVFYNNLKVLEKYKEYYLRSCGKLPKIDTKWLADFYFEKIKGCLSLKEVLERTQKEDFRIRLEDLLSDEDKEMIERNYPEEIEINGKIFKIKYKEIKGQVVPLLVVNSYEEFFEIENPPTLPSGETLGLIFDTFIFTDWTEAKNELRDMYIRAKFNKFIREIPPETLLVISIESNEEISKLEEIDENITRIREENPSLFTPKEYCIDPITKEPLYAYPFLEVEIGRPYLGKETQIGGEKTSYGFRIRINLKLAINQREAEIYNERYKEELRKLKDRLIKPILIEKLKSRVEEFRNVYDECVGSQIPGLSERIENILKETRLFISTIREERYLKDLSIDEITNIFQEISDKIEFVKKLAQLKAKIESFLYELECPFCKTKLSPDFRCDGYHDRDYIEGRKGKITLKRIVNERNETIAEIVLTEYGSIKLDVGEDSLLKPVWNGESFEEIKIIDLIRILSDEEVEEYRRKKKIEELELYEERLRDIIKQRPPSEYKYRKFVLGKNPKTGNEQFECKTRENNKTVIYVIRNTYVDRYYDELKYLQNFPLLIEYEEIKVDQPTFQFIIVKIDTDYLLTLNNYVGLFQEIFPEKSINEIIEEIEKIIEEVKRENE